MENSPLRCKVVMHDQPIEQMQSKFLGYKLIHWTEDIDWKTILLN